MQMYPQQSFGRRPGPHKWASLFSFYSFFKNELMYGNEIASPYI